MQKTIAAISSALSPSGIGIIRVSGNKAFDIVSKVFKSYNKKNLMDAKGYTAILGKIVDKKTVLDKVIALVFKAPKSYTGEDVVELSCHGSPTLLKKILFLLVENGAEHAQAGEFTKRSFLNGKLDLNEAEAVISLINSQSEEASLAAFNVLEGSLSNQIQKHCDALVHISATLASFVDYPDEEIEELSPKKLLKNLEKERKDLSALLQTYDVGKIIFEGINTVILGRPNVGKSTIMNLLTGYERSIITDIPGTTRDIIEDKVKIGNISLILSDTAGIRDSVDAIEKVGIEKAIKKAQSSSLILAVFDSSESLSSEDFRLLELCKDKKAIAVINKNDLESRVNIKDIKNYIHTVISISAKNKKDCKKLEKALEKLFETYDFDPSAPIIINERQRVSLSKAVKSISEAIKGMEMGITLDAINVLIDIAIEDLLVLKGERVSDRVIDEIFSKFCVGK